MKKIVCSILAASMLMGLSAFSVNAKSKFSDLDAVPWAEEAIDKMAQAGYVSGYSDGTFKPNKEISHLDGLLIFARIMGIDEGNMSEVTEYAIDAYMDFVEGLDISYGEDEMCFLLYRNVLTEDEMQDFIGNKNASSVMTRLEAAKYITKSMLADKVDNQKTVYELNYSDLEGIPNKDLGYIYYVSQDGVMTGTGNDNFSPNTALKRSQIAVMLSRIVENSPMSVIITNVNVVDYEGMSVKTADGNFPYGDATVMMSLGMKPKSGKIEEDTEAAIVLQNNKIRYLDVLGKIKSVKSEGYFVEYKSNNKTVTVLENGAEKKYLVTDDTEVKIDGTRKSIGQLRKGLYVSYESRNGKLISIEAKNTTKTIKNATVESVTINDSCILKINHEDKTYNGNEFVIPNEAVVTKNGEEVLPTELYRGDSVEIIFDGDNVVKVVAQSEQTNAEGVIKEIHIAPVSSIVIDVDGVEKRYDIAANAEIKVNGEKSSVYGLRLRDSVSVKLESMVLTSIDAESNTNDSFNNQRAKVVSVNKTYGRISIEYEFNGVKRNEVVIINNDKTKIMGVSSTEYGIDSLKEGTEITLFGNVNNGTMVASLIIVNDSEK